jgi:hypothetical protein
VQAELSREIRHRSGIGIDVIHPCVASFEVDVEILGLGEEPDGIVFG